MHPYADSTHRRVDSGMFVSPKGLHLRRLRTFTAVAAQLSSHDCLCSGAACDSRNVWSFRAYLPEAGQVNNGQNHINHQDKRMCMMEFNVRSVGQICPSIGGKRIVNWISQAFLRNQVGCLSLSVH